ncbi:MAG: hypothetical protein IJU57_05425, partial [Clostridia bacterium]|nr:hypothetical protein [Clostridia bacterium]
MLTDIQKITKLENYLRVMDVIATRPNPSRFDIMDTTGISLMTVGKVSNTLKDNRIIITDVIESNQRGRKAKSARISEEKYFSIFNMSSSPESFCKLRLSTLYKGKVSDFSNIEKPEGTPTKNFITASLARIDAENCIGIGIIIAPDSQVSFDAFADQLMEAFPGVPVAVVPRNHAVCALNLSDEFSDHKDDVLYVSLGDRSISSWFYPANSISVESRKKYIPLETLPAQNGRSLGSELASSDSPSGLLGDIARCIYCGIALTG